MVPGAPSASWVPVCRCRYAGSVCRCSGLAGWFSRWVYGFSRCGFSRAAGQQGVYRLWGAYRALFEVGDPHHFDASLATDLTAATVSVGDVIFNSERTKGSTLSFFVRHQTGAIGFITTGHIFKRGADERNEVVMLKKYDRSRDKHETYIPIGYVRYHRVGPRRDFALVELDRDQVNVRAADNEYTLSSNNRQLDIVSWEHHTSVRTGQIVYLLSDGKRVRGTVIDRNFTGYSNTNLKVNGKFACTFDYAPTRSTSDEVTRSGQILVTQGRDSAGSSTYQAVGILCGWISREVFLFTPIEFLLDGLAIPERQWHYLPCKRAADQNPVIGPAENESSREDDDDKARPLFELVHQLRKFISFSMEEED